MTDRTEAMTSRLIVFSASWVWLAIAIIFHNSTALIVSQIFFAAFFIIRAILEGKSNG